tara:strand:+ start:167 stop:853 length:687 start_codon:yes stop_codon:yes gene_type:complete
MLNPRHGLDWEIPQAYDIIDGEKVSNWEERLAKFKEFLSNEQPDIVLLQEVPGFAKAEIAQLMNIRVGSIKKSDLTNKNTAILLKDCDEYSKVKTTVGNSDRTVIKAKIKGQSYILGSMHLKGYNLNINEEKQALGLSDLNSILDTIKNEQTDFMIIGGDYNEHIRPTAARYDATIASGFTTQVDYDVTEVNAGTSIDGIFVKGLKPVKSYSVDIGASDHYAVVMEVE